MKDSNNKSNIKEFFGNVKKSFSGRKFRNGVYTSLISAVVIVIILVANMLFSKMNLQIDLSNQGMYTLTDETTGMIDKMGDDITIYYLVQSGNEVDQFKNIVKEYDASSDKITVINKDPILNPGFAAKYVDDTVQENSFIVYDKTNKRAKYIDYEDMLIQETNQTTYQPEITGIDVEGELTSAIQYVTSKDLPKMYIVEGHGETETGETFTSTMDKMNVDVDQLATLSSDSIPEDCDILFINSPTSDFSDTETTMIKDFLTAGGKAILTLDYLSKELKNFNSILEYYGIEMVEGVTLEGNANMHISNYPNYLTPNVKTHVITDLAYNNAVPVVMLNASGLLISDTKRSTLSLEPILTTSDESYAKVDLESANTAKEDADIAGPFNVGLLATDTYNDVTSNVVVYSSAYAFTEDTATYGNSDLLTGTVGYLVGNNDLLSIPTKSLASAHIYPSEQQAMMLAGMTVVVIPVIILIIGGVVCFRRRRK